MRTSHRQTDSSELYPPIVRFRTGWSVISQSPFVRQTSCTVFASFISSGADRKYERRMKQNTLAINDVGEVSVPERVPQGKVWRRFAGTQTGIRYSSLVVHQTRTIQVNCRGFTVALTCYHRVCQGKVEQSGGTLRFNAHLPRAPALRTYQRSRESGTKEPELTNARKSGSSPGMLTRK